MRRRDCFVICRHRVNRLDGRVTENIAFKRRGFVPAIAGDESEDRAYERRLET